MPDGVAGRGREAARGQTSSAAGWTSGLREGKAAKPLPAV
jgi:hypothetical protein